MLSVYASKRGEEGTSLVELSVAMDVSIVLLLTVAGSVSVFSKAEANVVKSANSAANTRLALLQFQSDVQAAVPVDSLSTVAAYQDELQVTVQPSGRVITWQYSPSTRTLTRQISSGAPAVELTNVTNGDPAGTPAGIPVFHYFDHCGNDLVSEATQGLGVNATTIAQQTTVIQITVAVAGLDTAPYGTTTSVNVMNRSPGPAAC